MIRLFSALAVPEDVAADLARRQQGLPGARWRTADQLHVTLRFYGEVPNDVAAEIDSGLSDLKGEPLTLELEGVGAFGEGENVRAIWAGVAENEALRLLQSRTEAAARRAGLPGEQRRYRPHVTLAYLKRPRPDRIAAWIAGHNLLKSPPFRVTWFGLYSSWLSQDGSRYELEREYPLQ